jgi:F-type H+-transporting ATPase subunit b
MFVVAASAATVLARPEGQGRETVSAIPTVDQGLVTGVVSLIVFGIVFAVLAVKVWPVIGKALDERAEKIREEIAAAEDARKQAKEALAQYEKSLAEARSEAQKMLEKTRGEQQALADELKAKADVELNALRERARRDIEAAKKAAIQEIYNHTANAATSIASKILRREVNQKDQQRLIEESMGELAAMKS